MLDLADLCRGSFFKWLCLQADTRRNSNTVCTSPLLATTREIITQISLSDDWTCGFVARRVLTHPLFDVPTTAALMGTWLYVVNAKLGTATEDVANTEYEILGVDRDKVAFVCAS